MRALFDQVDTDGNGSIEKSELKAMSSRNKS